MSTLRDGLFAAAEILNTNRNSNHYKEWLITMEDQGFDKEVFDYAYKSAINDIQYAMKLLQENTNGNI